MNVSVIIPVYNVEKYIERCARSLLEQTLKKDVEFIFVDDASPDKSITILDRILSEYPERKDQIRLIHHERNKGLAMARLSGINIARGEYIFHLDSDDYLDREALSKFYNKISIDPTIDILIGNYATTYDKNIRVKILDKIKNPILLAKEIIKRKQPCTIWNKFIRKSLYNNMEIPLINNGEDYVTMPRLAYKAENIQYIDEITYYYTYGNPDSMFRNPCYLDKNITDMEKSIIF